MKKTVSGFILGSILLLGSVLNAQQNGSAGRVTGAQHHTPGSSSYTVSLSISTITCSGTTCASVSPTMTSPSVPVSGTISFAASHDPVFLQGGSTGGGVGMLEVSCNGGSSWIVLAAGSGSIPTPVSYSYNTASCSGITNLSTLLFRTELSGGGPTGFNESFQSPTNVIITW